jgi:hypothetical protein
MTRELFRLLEGGKNTPVDMYTRKVADAVHFAMDDVAKMRVNNARTRRPQRGLGF